MKIYLSKKFQKKYKKMGLIQKRQVDRAVVLFRSNPNHVRLRNHPLKGSYKGLRSISAASDLRIILKVKGNYIVVIFVTVGTHSQLY